ncbi:MAG TPA: exo-beta-N-acetylmuramidase NamZ domain-containing protein [Pyrinomonadaceae bacterium]
MFERYTEKARRAIFFARYEASQFGTQEIVPEQLLLGLIREDRILIDRFFPRGRVSLEEIRREIAGRSLLQEKFSTSVELPLAPETKRVLAYAHEESDRLQHRHIGTEHLLLGLLREERSMAAEILYERGLRLVAVRERVSQMTGAAIESGAGPRLLLGLEKLLRYRLDLLKGARVGLICNQSSVDHDLRHAADLFHDHSEIKLTALFGPQHGIRGDVQDNMVETAHSVDRKTGLPIHSLYSETREPTEQMLEDVDVLVFDMQDVGCRIYTFIYTLANCMRAAGRYGKRVVVCDRPNPITGSMVAGNVLEPEYASFVGQFPIPTRHGMTVCELARLFREHFGIDCELENVLMEGWDRELWLDETDAPWVMPSPNMPTLETATVFPGTVHLEGTQLSEGRGTTRPFELVGAPYIEAEAYAAHLTKYGLPGVHFRACGFQPTFQKHAGRACGGVQIHVLKRQEFEPVAVGVCVVKAAYDLYGEDFRWKEPPYEYVHDKNPFDVIAGTNRLREAIERRDTLESIVASWQEGLEEFKRVREAYLLY